MLTQEFPAEFPNPSLDDETAEQIAALVRAEGWTSQAFKLLTKAGLSPFKIQLSDFKFIQTRSGKALRLTVTWSFTHPEFGLIGDSTEGCMVSRTQEGFRFSPPISRFGPNQSKQLHSITTDYHDLIIRLLRNHKTKSGQTYLDYVGNEMPDALRPKDPAEIDPELPREVGTEKEENEG